MGESAFDARNSPLEARLEQLTPGTEILGIAGSGSITVIHSQWIGTQAVTVTYREGSVAARPGVGRAPRGSGLDSGPLLGITFGSPVEQRTLIYQ